MSDAQFNSKTRLQMATEYGVDYKTFMRLLKKHDIQLPRGLIYPKSQKNIYEHLGYPSAEIKMEFKEF